MILVIRIHKSVLSAVLIFVILLCGIGVFVHHRQQAPVMAWGVSVDIPIVLDAGHGGEDSGAVAEDGTMEKVLNLDIALRLKSLLELAGYRVYMTRETDISLCENSFIKKEDMQNRLDLARTYPKALFISIHLNKFSMKQYSGAQIFYSGNHEDSYVLAQAIQQSIKNNLQPENTRQVKLGDENSILLRCLEQPAVIVEGGFLSNPEELAQLNNEAYRSKLSYCIFLGIMQYQQEKEGI